VSDDTGWRTYLILFACELTVVLIALGLAIALEGLKP
jgi:hypothetical protein